MSKATRATKMLEQAGAAFSTHTYEYDGNADRIGLQAAEALGEDPSRVLKSLMALVDGKPGVSLDWFNMLYQVLLGQEKGPRFGSFVAVYGLANTVEMIDGALARSA